jgi:SPP1 family predicted phage head-tail adaptor
MNPGELKHKIEIQYYVAAENEIYEQVKQWQTYKKVWAKIHCVGNGREQIKAGKQELSLDYEIIIRYTPGINTSMRIIYKDKVYNIDHVVNYKELNVELHLFCTLQEEGALLNE